MYAFARWSVHSLLSTPFLLNGSAAVTCPPFSFFVLFFCFVFENRTFVLHEEPARWTKSKMMEISIRD